MEVIALAAAIATGLMTLVILSRVLATRWERQDVSSGMERVIEAQLERQPR